MFAIISTVIFGDANASIRIPQSVFFFAQCPFPSFHTLEAQHSDEAAQKLRSSIEKKPQRHAPDASSRALCAHSELHNIITIESMRNHLRSYAGHVRITPARASRAGPAISAHAAQSGALACAKSRPSASTTRSHPAVVVRNMHIAARLLGAARLGSSRHSHELRAGRAAGVV